MNFKKSSISFIGLCLLLNNPSAIYAQNARSQGMASLGEMGCKSIGSGEYENTNEDIVVGREVFSAVALLDTSGGQISGSSTGIDGDTAAGVACRLAPANGAPAFKTLSLSFGLDEGDNRRNDESVTVRLSVYTDGNFYGETTISKGEKQRWIVDVLGTRSVSLEAECVRSSNNSDRCPGLYFFEDILKK